MRHARQEPMKEFAPIEVCVAVALYSYNTSLPYRAEALGLDPAMPTIDILGRAHFATHFSMDVVAKYIKQALARYGDEAIDRVAHNSGVPLADRIRRSEREASVEALEKPVGMEPASQPGGVRPKTVDPFFILMAKNIEYALSDLHDAQQALNSLLIFLKQKLHSHS